MIGIIGAMKIEIDGLKALMTDKKTEIISGIEYNIGNINGKRCVCAVSGIGKVHSAVCAQTMVLKYNPSFIINTGVAGGIVPEIKIGDIAIAQNVMQHDIDTSALGDKRGMISGLKIINIPCDENIVNKISEFCTDNNIPFKTGTIATGDQFINNKEQLIHMGSEYAAIACEMEGGSIGQVCYMNRVKFSVIRAISDTANSDAAIHYNDFAVKAAKVSADVVINLIENM